jgi:hypothetical protein
MEITKICNNIHATKLLSSSKIQRVTLVKYAGLAGRPLHSHTVSNVYKKPFALL